MIDFDIFDDINKSSVLYEFVDDIDGEDIIIEFDDDTEVIQEGLYEKYLRRHAYDPKTNTIVVDGWVDSRGIMQGGKRINVGKNDPTSRHRINAFLRDHKFNPNDETILTDIVDHNGNQRRVPFTIDSNVPFSRSYDYEKERGSFVDGSHTVAGLTKYGTTGDLSGFSDFPETEIDPITKEKKNTNISSDSNTGHISMSHQLLRQKRNHSEPAFGHEQTHQIFIERVKRALSDVNKLYKNILQLNNDILWNPENLPESEIEQKKNLLRKKLNKLNAIVSNRYGIKIEPRQTIFGDESYQLTPDETEKLFETVKNQFPDIQKIEQFIHKYAEQMNDHDKDPVEIICDINGMDIAKKYTKDPNIYNAIAKMDSHHMRTFRNTVKRLGKTGPRSIPMPYSPNSPENKYYELRDQLKSECPDLEWYLMYETELKYASEGSEEYIKIKNEMNELLKNKKVAECVEKLKKAKDEWDQMGNAVYSEPSKSDEALVDAGKQLRGRGTRTGSYLSPRDRLEIQKRQQVADEYLQSQGKPTTQRPVTKQQTPATSNPTPTTSTTGGRQAALQRSMAVAPTQDTSQSQTKPVEEKSQSLSVDNPTGKPESKPIKESDEYITYDGVFFESSDERINDTDIRISICSELENIIKPWLEVPPEIWDIDKVGYSAPVESFPENWLHNTETLPLIEEFLSKMKEPCQNVMNLLKDLDNEEFENINEFVEDTSLTVKDLLDSDVFKTSDWEDKLTQEHIDEINSIHEFVDQTIKAVIAWIKKIYPQYMEFNIGLRRLTSGDRSVLDE